MARFQRIWGAKWIDHVQAAGGIGAVAEEWRRGIAGMTGDQIRTAVDRCRKAKAWPPTIAEFRQAAGIGSSWEHNSPAYRPFPATRQLSSDERDSRRRELAAEHLSAARAAMHRRAGA